LLLRVPERAALVVAPTSVGFNWLREAERFAPGLEMRAFWGKGNIGMLEGLVPGTVVVTSYDRVVRYGEELARNRFATLLLDEAQALKNPATLRARAVFALDAEVCVALTGTPIENRTGEIGSLFHAIAPGLLGSADPFQDRFARPIERDGDTGQRAVLARLVAPFVLRRLKHDVEKGLPARTEVRLDIELSPEAGPIIPGWAPAAWCLDLAPT
jgi:SNF2 family DNA or RNA helicase